MHIARARAPAHAKRYSTVAARARYSDAGGGVPTARLAEAPTACARHPRVAMAKFYCLERSVVQTQCSKPGVPKGVGGYSLAPRRTADCANCCWLARVLVCVAVLLGRAHMMSCALAARCHTKNKHETCSRTMTAQRVEQQLTMQTACVC